MQVYAYVYDILSACLFIHTCRVELDRETAESDESVDGKETEAETSAAAARDVARECDGRSAPKRSDDGKEVGNEDSIRAGSKVGGWVGKQRRASGEGGESIRIREAEAGPEVLVAMGFAWPDVLEVVGGKTSLEGIDWQAAACALAWRAGEWGQNIAGGQLSKEALEEKEALTAIFGQEAFTVEGNVWRVAVDGISGTC